MNEIETCRKLLLQQRSALDSTLSHFFGPLGWPAGVDMPAYESAYCDGLKKDIAAIDAALSWLATVEATQMQEWQPLSDGFLLEAVTFEGRHTERVSVTQDWLTVAWRPETGDEYKASAQLPDNIRLCRLAEKGADDADA